MAESSVSAGLIEQLKLVFTPMDERLRANLIDLIKKEMDQRPIVAFASDVPRNVWEEVDTPIVDANGNPVAMTTPAGEPVYLKDDKGNVLTDEGENPIPRLRTWKKLVPVERVNVWALGAPSPSDPDCTIFGMVLHEGLPAIVVWSVKRTEREDGLIAYEYFHERVRNFHIAQGPASAKALYLDMLASFSDEPEPDPEHAANGASA